MAKSLDKIIVVDVEATCWEKQPIPYQPNEIIEIGVSVLDIKKMEVIDNRGILVKPEHSEISQFCTQLTTITPEMIEHGGISFKDACSMLDDMNVHKWTWASYGDYDRIQFEKDCKLKNVINPFGRTHINIKNLFALRHQLPREVGMSQALEILKFPLKGTHHRGIWDSLNCSAILMSLLR